MLACSVIGGPATVRRGIEAFLARTRADELMVVSDLFDFTKRLRSFEIIADACGLVASRATS
jgi:alkanesulfonate monooxygenase SsuD/methylene tetrahydromethanopterin reductase-like flavin-dependent oxidoreductase (luciferase family)